MLTPALSRLDTYPPGLSQAPLGTLLPHHPEDPAGQQKSPVGEAEGGEAGGTEGAARAEGFLGGGEQARTQRLLSAPSTRPVVSTQDPLSPRG